ncbi:MAG: DNA primase [Patescibacteria group bacterium]|jgi:DNA primase
MDPKEEIKQKLDVAEVIAEYVTLKPAGSGAFKGLCPFHSERTPSFHVSRERQIFKCFGCDKGGDVFSFVMEMEGLNFVEALKMLAKRAGVELPEYKPTPGGNRADVLLEIHEAAAKFYEIVLHEWPRSVSAREYIAKRKLSDAMVLKFRLGASPDDWDSLALHLKKKGYSEELLVESGLCLKRKSGSGVIDRFRNRIMVPLCDPNGHVVGFTARILPGAGDEEAKYINSPETPIYHKGAVLYGLHLGKSGIRKAGEVIVVEGNLDVIASHSAGVENVVASSGTALTEAQLRTLFRYTKRLVFCLDDDAAGFAAAKRVFALALELQTKDPSLDVSLRCIVIPSGAGKDPDDVVQKDPELWRKIAVHSTEIVEYYFEKTLRSFDEKTDSSMEARRKLVDELLPEVAKLVREDERHLYLLRLADATHVSVDILRTMMTKIVLPKKIGASNSSVPLRRTGDARIAPIAPSESASPETQRTRASAFLLGVALKYEKAAGEVLKRVPLDVLEDPWKTLYRELGVVYNAGQTQPSTAPQQSLFLRLRAHLDGQGSPRFISVVDALALRIDEMLARLSPKDVRAEVDRHLILFTRERQQERRKDLESKIRQAEIAGDHVLLSSLMDEYNHLLQDKEV